MREREVNKLCKEVYEFLLERASLTDLSGLEIASAVGQALVMVILVPCVGYIREKQKLQQEPVEEDETPDWEDEIEFQGQDERLFALYLLSSRYSDEIVDLIIKGKMKTPGWLQKEILERRG